MSQLAGSPSETPTGVCRGIVGVALACVGVAVLYLSAESTTNQRGSVEELFSAARTGDLARVDAALRSGVEIDARESGSMRTPLARAAKYGRVQVVQRLLDA